MMSAASRALTVVRVLVSLLLFIHGTYRLLTGGPPLFAQYLDGVGVPLAIVVAWGITLMEVFGTPLLALGKFVQPLALWFSTVLIAGIIMVHAPEGWFVVGAGRNGMEYSALLVSLLLTVAWEDWARSRSAA